MKNAKWILFGLLLLSTVLPIFSQINIIPQPNDIVLTPEGGSFKITPKTKIVIKDKNFE